MIPLYTRLITFCARLIPLYTSVVPLSTRMITFCARLIPLYTSVVPLYTRLITFCARLIPLYTRVVPWYSGVMMPGAGRITTCSSGTPPAYPSKGLRTPSPGFCMTWV